jgi:hypothetical protein
MPATCDTLRRLISFKNDAIGPLVVASDPILPIRGGPRIFSCGREFGHSDRHALSAGLAAVDSVLANAKRIESGVLAELRDGRLVEWFIRRP